MSKFTLPKEGGLLENKIPKGILHSYEKIPTKVYDEETEACKVIADVVASAIKKHNGIFKLGLGTESDLLPIYTELVKLYEAWLKECHVWLYRGAWMEWELGRVDMAVPLSPGEVIKKRHAIYRHQSQKDIVPFPGEDSREFWQRAEDRTQNTARLYDNLGMAEYKAIEVFVKLF